MESFRGKEGSVYKRLIRTISLDAIEAKEVTLTPARRVRKRVVRFKSRYSSKGKEKAT
jgi:hypothetical protein